MVLETLDKEKFPQQGFVNNYYPFWRTYQTHDSLYNFTQIPENVLFISIFILCIKFLYIHSKMLYKCTLYFVYNNKNFFRKINFYVTFEMFSWSNRVWELRVGVNFLYLYKKSKIFRFYFKFTLISSSANILF